MEAELFTNVAVASVAGVLGFALSWFLEERKQHHELRRSAGPLRVEAYRSLWPLCGQDHKNGQGRQEQADAMFSWYESGGGLFLSFAAAEHFFDARKLLLTKHLSEQEQKEVWHHLTWLRTEMKHHIGSYTRKEAATQL